MSYPEKSWLVTNIIMSTMNQTKDTKSKPLQGSKSRPTKGHATTAERLEALKRYYVNGYSVKLLASQYQVTSCTIRNWIRIFEQENPVVAKAMNKKRIPPQGTSSEELSKDDYVAMKARILELEKALHQARLERDVFKTCLEVYGVDEQKKSGHSSWQPCEININIKSRRSARC